MKWFKILRICILLLMMAPAVHATVYKEDITNYWNFSNDAGLKDMVSSINWTKTGSPGYSAGKVGNMIGPLTGSNYLTSTEGLTKNQDEYALGFWVKTPAACSNYHTLFSSDSDNRLVISPLFDSSCRVYANVFDTADANTALTYFDSTPTNSYSYLSISYNKNDANKTKICIDGTCYNGSATGLAIKSQSVWKAGYQINIAGRDWSGYLDDFWIAKNKSFTADELNFVYNNYNNGTYTGYNSFPATPPSESLTFQNITLEGTTNFNNTFWNSTTLNFTTEVLNISTNGNVNQTYFLYNSTGGLIASSQFANNSLNGSFELSSLSEETYKISFYAVNNETNVSAGNYTFSVDITPPTINNSLPSNISSYELGNLSSYVSCANIGSGSCVIYFSPQNVTYNSSDTVTFTSNGNQSYVITATDGAGNTATESGVLLVNPLQYFRFYDTLRALYVEDYSFGNYNSSGQYVTIPLYDLGLGNQSLQFSRFGYTQENFQFNFNSTSALNQTFNVSAITITVQVFDESSPLTQLTFNLSMNNVSNYTQYLNQLNFSKYYNETLHGNLTLTAESSGYSARKIFTQLNPYTAVSHVIYLLADADSTPVIFRVLNLAQTQSIEDVVFTFKKEISGTPTFLGQAKTDSQGYTYFNMDVLGDYQITISKSGYVTQIINSIPGKSEYTILMEEEGSSTPFLFENFNYYFTPSSSSVSSVPFNVSAYTFDEANLISSMRFTVTGDNTSFTDVLTISSGGTIQFTVTNASPQYLLNLTVMRDGQEYNFIKKLNYYQTAASNATVQKVAQELDGSANTENRVFMMIILYVVAVVLGSLFSPTVGAVAGLLPITIFAIPSVGWLTPGVAALFYLITILGVLYFER